MENLRINTVYVADIDTIAFPFDYDQDSVTQMKDFEVILSSFASLANVFAIPYNSVYVGYYATWKNSETVSVDIMIDNSF